MEQENNSVVETEETSQAFAGKTPAQWKHYWQKEMTAEEKRNRQWRSDADLISCRYLDERKDQGPQYNSGNAEFRVNLFHSNIFTLTSFLYGRIPSVDVSRRFTDSNDDQARVAANILERMLNTSVESDGGDFSSVLRGNLEDHLVPGMGVARVRYEFDTEEVQTPPEVDQFGMVVSPGGVEEKISWEDAPVDYVYWGDFHWGHSRMWKDVPWVGFDIFFTREEAKERFGDEIASRLKYDQQSIATSEKGAEETDTKDPEKTARVTEIWNKKTLSVFWYHQDIDTTLDIKPDPLELDAFFPCPRPMVANLSTKLFRPRPYFMLAMDLYNEVDQLSTRINIITNAVKVVGAYDKSVPELKNMLQNSIENDLVPVDNWAMLGEKGGVKGVVEFFPLADIVAALDKLREMRREAIDLLYQVTGLSDIMRGTGEQYKAASNAKLEAKFGSVRIQYLQDEFARYATDLLNIRAEIICKHFEPETIIQQSNIGRSYDAPMAQQALALIKQPGQMLWRVQVKPESMAMVDWAQLKADRTEFLTALATFMQSAGPLIQLIPGSVPMLLELLKWGLAGFKGGQEIETVLDQAIQQATQALQQQQQGQQKPDPEVQKAQLKMQADQKKAQADLMKEMTKAANEMKKISAQLQANLIEKKAEVMATAAKEIVQANQNIREKRATQQVTKQ